MQWDQHDSVRYQDAQPKQEEVEKEKEILSSHDPLLKK